jgi:hypothetical protein
MKLKAQTNTVSFGFNINQVQNDFGLGIDIVSPYFSNSKIAVKLGGNFKWLEHLEFSETTWTPYQNIQIGIRGRQFIMEDKLFIYGEGGSVLLFPNTKFSTESTKFGGYGIFGFECKPTDQFGFYFEMGGVGTGATADKITNKPIYSNGFLTNVGFRIIP